MELRHDNDNLELDLSDGNGTTYMYQEYWVYIMSYKRGIITKHPATKMWEIRCDEGQLISILPGVLNLFELTMVLEVIEKTYLDGVSEGKSENNF